MVKLTEAACFAFKLNKFFFHRNLWFLAGSFHCIRIKWKVKLTEVGLMRVNCIRVCVCWYLNVCKCQKKGTTVSIAIDDTSCTQPAPYNSGFIHSMHFCMLVTCDQPTFAHSVLEAKALEQILSNARQFLKMVTSTKTATKQCTHWKYACPLHRRVKISVFISTNIIGRLSSLCVHKYSLAFASHVPF